MGKAHEYRATVFVALVVILSPGCGSKSADVTIEDPTDTEATDAPKPEPATPGTVGDTGLATSAPSPVSTGPGSEALSDEAESRMAELFTKEYNRLIRWHVIREEQLAEGVAGLREAGPEMAAYLLKLAEGDLSESSPYHWALVCGGLVDQAGEAGRSRVAAIATDKSAPKQVREWARKALDGALAPDATP